MNKTIYIKNMVCPRCISAVSHILDQQKIRYTSIKLGEVKLLSTLDSKTKSGLSQSLLNSGFSLIDNRKSQLIEQMKTLVVDKIHHSSGELHIKWGEYISQNLHLDYKYLGSLFSSVESITLEQYIINQKIERVKELIIYDELTLSQIAFKLDYSSVAYLSNQFKKVTGMTPTKFKKSTNKNRKSLDEI
ncbi:MULTISPECIES: helix-turn-helix domain-containing protein [unclassified Olleya]|jgi:AraC-like DNA-binding protein|uniref:helix-turn-helix domain-containing protein n=1 Tax=unclassified Olleya TaxID=2615019 RepID=UPI0011A30731|nr:AraC family transcriptional regulator [Olleya sp. Hel_I_94]TVZ49924.1 helix-turn-helix protein [Olleya sp. Hel_I_94]|tara:strand:+ start:717 stop:1283 length:567 start_codon:yes stop_codon:yes gene_type:complete